MILNTSAENVADISEELETSDFKIVASVKSFQVLSSGLYSNKVRAIVRELSCNAVDSHKAAGKEDVPFEIHLPTTLEPWFSVKDYGVGLSSDEVKSVYTTYFESTKTSSNEYIGALGLGSKSPFSYTSNFTITAIKNGIKSVHGALISANGRPSTVRLGQETTDEPSGLEVKFSVKPSDFYSFVSETKEVLKWFRSKPIVTGVKGFSIPELDIVEENIIPGVHRFGSSSQNIALMGNIAYPISLPSDVQGSSLLCGLLIEFNIGELDFSASRESLSYIPLTVSSIEKKLIELEDHLRKYIENGVDERKTYWDKSLFLASKRYDALWKGVVNKYMQSNMYVTKDKQIPYDRQLCVPKNCIEGTGLEFKLYKFSHTVRPKLINPFLSTSAGQISAYINISPDTVFVIDDMKTGLVSRITEEFGSTHKVVYVIKSPDLATSSESISKLLELVGNPPAMIASQLKAPPARVRRPVAGVCELVQHERSYRVYSYKWVPTKNTQRDKKYYLVLKGNTVQVAKDSWILYCSHLDKSIRAFPEFKDITIYGVRQLHLDSIKDDPTWVDLSLEMRTVLLNISPSQLREIAHQEYLHKIGTPGYVDQQLKNLVNADSEYRKFCDVYTIGKDKLTGKVSKAIIEYLANMFDVDIVFDDTISETTKCINRLFSVYPMLKCIDWHDIYKFRAIVAEYINFIDAKLSETADNSSKV